MFNDSLINLWLPYNWQNNNVTLWREAVSANNNKGVEGAIVVESDGLERRKPGCPKSEVQIVSWKMAPKVQHATPAVL